MDARVMDGYKMKAIVRGANRAVHAQVAHARREKARKRTLILSSYAWPSSDAGSAAAVLRVLKMKSEVLPMKSEELLDFLAAKGETCDRIYIVGINITGDEDEVAGVFRKLAAAEVKVYWMCNCAGREAGALGAKLKGLGLLDFFTSDGTDIQLDQKILERYGVDVSDLYELGEMVYQNWYLVADVTATELVEAAIWCYQSYGRTDVYEMVIQRMADKGSLDRGEETSLSKIVEHFRRFKRRELRGDSPAMTELRENIRRIAKSPDARVMILGESGTGKETVALQLHYGSRRYEGKFIAFNCATVNPQLIESRLFGYEKGSFTGADKQKPGLFEEADGGTLFLDEIGELGLEVQGILLRALEEGRIMRVGGSEEIPVDVRLITATNRDLPTMVRDGKFRADLYQRLCVVQIRIPPLREHKSDIADIVAGWANMQSKPNRPYFEPPTDEQIADLTDYDYPGNVRELINLLDRAKILGETDYKKLLRDHREMNAGLLATPDVRIGKREASADGSVNCTVVAHDENGIRPLEDAIRAHVRSVYEKCGENATETARVLKVSRNTVRKYL